jgi:hypothetical protein
VDRSRAHRTQLTARDLELLGFIAEHRLVLPRHAQVFLGVSAGTAYARLRRLTDAGYLVHDHKLYREPGYYQATRQGLAAVGVGYRPRPVDLNLYRHDVGTAWLWLAGRRGVFGPMRAVIGERRMRSQDGAAPATQEPFGVRLGGYGPGGRPRLHYPDLLFVTPKGKRIAVELELTGKGRARREKILSGYAADPRVDAVLYLVHHRNHPLARSIEDSARRAGIGSIVQVQPFRWGASHRDRGAAPAAERSVARGRESSHAPVGRGRESSHALAPRPGVER